MRHERDLREEGWTSVLRAATVRLAVSYGARSSSVVIGVSAGVRGERVARGGKRGEERRGENVLQRVFHDGANNKQKKGREEDQRTGCRLRERTRGAPYGQRDGKCGRNTSWQVSQAPLSQVAIVERRRVVGPAGVNKVHEAVLPISTP